MPSGGAEARGEQLELVARLVHQRMTDEGLWRLLQELEQRGGLSPEDEVNIRERRRVLERERKLPESFVGRKAQAVSAAYVAWAKARPNDDYAAMRPHLARMFEFARQEADLVGYREHPYDALLDVFEPGMTVRVVKPLLCELGDSLRALLPWVMERLPRTTPNERSYPEERVRRLCEQVVRDLGYDFSRGRLDKTVHPFATTIALGDIRITIRYSEAGYHEALFGAVHEAGHALYEQGFLAPFEGAPMAEAVSMGVHESQSRLWENMVARSRPFAHYLHGVLKERLPEEYARTSPDEIWQLANQVRPSLNRVEADEVTYVQHIVIRMLLEEELVTGALTVGDLPERWNDLYERYLGVRPANFRDGVLQDVHWFSGLVGYFPSYALGNLYAAMMFDAAAATIPDLDGQMEQGRFDALLGWLRTNVHQHGMRYPAADLLRRISGKEVSSEAFLTYLRMKFA